MKVLASAICGLLLLFFSAALSCAQEPDSRIEITAEVQKLSDGKRWQEIVALTEGATKPRPEVNYLRGIALMRLERYAEAKEAFSAGYSAAPQDVRFPIERAGAEYRLKDFVAAKADLRSALHAEPNDKYALDFLGTIYLLEGNLDAALKYWNRAGKPRLASITLQPRLQMASRLKENAIVFNAPQVLERGAWLTTDARLEKLGMLPQRRLELAPAGEQDYAAVLHLTERNWRDNFRWTGLISLASGTPYQTIYFDAYNIVTRAMNFKSMARWDAEKRRVYASLSLPVEERADRALSIFVDGRDENWNLSQTFFGSVTPVRDLNLRSLEAGGEFSFVVNGDWSWSAGASVIGRTFRNAGTATNTTAPALFTSGTTLKSWVGATQTLLRIPERRFTVVGTADSEFGRGFKEALGPFGSLGGSVKADWLPHASGDQDSFHVKTRAASIFGAVPLDQVYEMGLDRDSTLWLRGHRATIDGKKGGAPLGRRFVLINAEYDRTLYDAGLFRVQVGPLLDMGRITGSSGTIGDARWLVDTGVQVKLRVFGAVSVVLSYGRDLRNGKGAFFGTTER